MRLREEQRGAASLATEPHTFSCLWTRVCLLHATTVASGQRGQSGYDHRGALWSLAAPGEGTAETGGRDALGPAALQGGRGSHSQNTHVTLSLWGLPTFDILAQPVSSAEKEHISSTLVHYHLGNCLFSIILTTHKLLVLDFPFKSPSSFFFFLNFSGCLYNSFFVFVFPCTLSLFWMWCYLSHTNWSLLQTGHTGYFTLPKPAPRSGEQAPPGAAGERDNPQAVLLSVLLSQKVFI